ncbi:MAG: putative C-S lyase [Chloroflexi bacterium]|nr:putative C-S lyase [Chloroflexota bacterium]
MMHCDFDRTIDRRHSDSAKWCRYEEDVLPLWVADMDFAAPPAVIDALRERVHHGVFGYCRQPSELNEVIQARLAQLYDWRVRAEDIFLIPGVMRGVNLACHAVGQPGDDIMVEPPVYTPLLLAPANAQRQCVTVPLIEESRRYTHDFDALEQAVTQHTSMVLLCNPHNPVGRVFDQAELTQLAEICLRHNLIICTDEIHGDIIYEGHRHIPIASLDPEIAQRTITFFAPSKTYNIAGLSCSVGVVQNPDLRAQLEAARGGLVSNVNVLGLTAMLAAYTDGPDWLDSLLHYLQGNRDYLHQEISEHMPTIGCSPVEGTFLAWLDCRDSGIQINPHTFFLERARVALNDGAGFGEGGEGFVRLNFGCPRATLIEALRRMRAAMETIQRP